MSFIVYPLLLHRPTSTQFYNIYLFPLTLEIMATADAFFFPLTLSDRPHVLFTNLFSFFFSLHRQVHSFQKKALYRDIRTARYARSDNLKSERSTYFYFIFIIFSSRNREGNYIQRCVTGSREIAHSRKDEDPSKCLRYCAADALVTWSGFWGRSRKCGPGEQQPCPEFTKVLLP